MRKKAPNDMWCNRLQVPRERNVSRKRGGAGASRSPCIRLNGMRRACRSRKIAPERIVREVRRTTRLFVIATHLRLLAPDVFVNQEIVILSELRICFPNRARQQILRSLRKTIPQKYVDNTQSSPSPSDDVFGLHALQSIERDVGVRSA